MMHRSRQAIADADRSLVESLLAADDFAGAVDPPELVETHISWIILAGDYAYKIKKPLKLPFLDFSTLELRRHFCEEELRLNRPSAPEIYIDVVAITTKNGRACIGGDGETVEYAVRMRRFDQSARLDAQLEAGQLSVRDMRELGEVVAARHEGAARIDADRRDRQVTMTKRFIRDNFAALDGFLDEGLLKTLNEWSERDIEARRTLFAERFDAGFVRECHGDLHLGNLVRLDSGIAPFDCIEFDEDLRAIDVICDVGFLAMDLVARGRRDLAAHFINRYLERSGDYAGVALLDTYFVYRCLVRAKVEAISSQECNRDPERREHLAETRRYAEIALRQTRKPEPFVILMHGLSGSGKTWLSARLMAALPAIRVRSDVERKRLFGLDERQASGSAVADGIYTAESTERVYARLNTLAGALLHERHSVLLDAAFLDRSRRAAAIDTAREAGCRALVLHTEATPDLLRGRIASRSATGSDASEAGLAVLEHQLEGYEPLSADEGVPVIVCDTGAEPDVDRLATALRRRAKSREAA